MNTKQKTVIGVGLAVVIAMALYPPWATWCIPVDERDLQTDLQIQYGWLFGRVTRTSLTAPSVPTTTARRASPSILASLAKQGSTGCGTYVKTEGGPRPKRRLC